MPLRRSTSCEFTSFSHGAEYHTELEKIKERRTRSACKKSVQWSDDLEEVRYFVPHRSRSESIKRKFKKAKRRAEQFTEKPLMRVFTSIGESRVKRLRIIGRHTNCFSLDSGMQSFEEYNKQWDILFEMYSSPNFPIETTTPEVELWWCNSLFQSGVRFVKTLCSTTLWFSKKLFKSPRLTSCESDWGCHKDSNCIVELCSEFQAAC